MDSVGVPYKVRPPKTSPGGGHWYVRNVAPIEGATFRTYDNPHPGDVSAEQKSPTQTIFSPVVVKAVKYYMGEIFVQGEVGKESMTNVAHPAT